jgi:hypothetical protein
MKPITFEAVTNIFGPQQGQRTTLPAHVDQTGNVTTCWKANLMERLAFLFTGKLWVTQQTFNDKVLQPIFPVTLNPLTPVPIPLGPHGCNNPGNPPAGVP